MKRPLSRAWKKGTRLYPIRLARFKNQPSLVRKTDELQTTHIEFFIDDNNPFTAAPPVENYQSYPVLTLRPDESKDLTSTYQRLMSRLDNGMALPRLTDMSGSSFMVQSYKWLGMGRKHRRQFRELIYYLNGKQKALWVPSHFNDLTAVGRIIATEPVLTIKQCGYSRFAKNDPDKQHLYILLTDGRAFFRKIIDSKETSATEEQLLLDQPLHNNLRAGQIARISYLRLCRSNSDTVEINHITDSEGVASSELTFRRVRDNEL